MVEGMPDAARFAEIVGGAFARTKPSVKGTRPEIAAFGEMVSLLWTEGKIEAAVRLEQLWNELAKQHSFSLRCAYPVANFYGEKNTQPLMRVCAEHSAVVLEEGQSSFTNAEAKIALRRTEERFRLLVDAVQDYAIFMLDTQGHVSSWNTGAARIKGYAVSESIGKNLSICYTEDDIWAGKPARELEIAAKDGRFEDEGWRLRKDGSRFWANVILTAIRDVTGALIGFLVGIGIAAWIGRVNFHAPVMPRLSVLPVVLAGSMAVTLLSAILPMAMLRRVQPAVILRGE